MNKAFKKSNLMDFDKILSGSEKNCSDVDMQRFAFYLKKMHTY